MPIQTPLTPRFGVVIPTIANPAVLLPTPRRPFPRVPEAPATPPLSGSPA